MDIKCPTCTEQITLPTRTLRTDVACHVQIDLTAALEAHECRPGVLCWKCHERLPPERFRWSKRRGTYMSYCIDCDKSGGGTVLALIRKEN